LLWQQNIKADDCVGTPQGCHEISVMSRFWVAPKRPPPGLQLRTDRAMRTPGSEPPRWQGDDHKGGENGGDDLGRLAAVAFLHVANRRPAVTLREASRVSSDRRSALSRYKAVTPPRPNTRRPSTNR
jgi:hypothetical protein